MDDSIEADFIGGIWDGRTYAIPFVYEWQVAVIHTNPAELRLAVDMDEILPYDVAVYKNMGHGIFWLSRIEKR